LTVSLDCVVSDWSAWTTSDQTGTVTRIRMQVRPAINGGKKCPNMIESLYKQFDFLLI
jgi:hypothetical protein